MMERTAKRQIAARWVATRKDSLSSQCVMSCKALGVKAGWPEKRQEEHRGEGLLCYLKKLYQGAEISGDVDVPEFNKRGGENSAERGKRYD